jgi:hydroxymethylpyrimidine pyrophosphatase-like HAD family hydrolase
MDLGIYRQVCSNGAIAFDQHGEKTQIKHTEINANNLQKFIQSVNNKTNKVLESFGILQNKNMTVEEARKFAYKAAQLRYTEDQISDITINDLLSINRIEDESNDLWTVFNRVQENLTADVSNFKTDIILNQKLFSLADQYAIAL